MNSYSANTPAECLTLESKLSEISRVVPPWIERLASLHAISDRTRYAMDLCLEEVLSNIVRHGYACESSRAIIIRYVSQRDGFTLVVEDEAPPFNPLITEDPPIPRSLENASVGGQGIHLVKQFADAIEYEPMPSGNRLIIKFISPETSRAVV